VRREEGKEGRREREREREKDGVWKGEREEMRKAIGRNSTSQNAFRDISDTG